MKDIYHSLADLLSKCAEQSGIVVVVDKPSAVMPRVRKLQYKIVRRYKRNIAMTLNQGKRRYYRNKIELILNQTAVAGTDKVADVHFVTVKEALADPQQWNKMFVATPTDKIEIYMISGFMGRGREVVVLEA